MPTEAPPQPSPSAAQGSFSADLTQRGIVRLWWPLALSWVFMALEGPIAMTTLGRFGDVKIQAAAFQIFFAIALWIESPVIDLLSTATTLVKSQASFRALQKFVFQINLGVTAVHGLVAFTPIYDWVARSLLGVPIEVAEAARLPFQIMLPWSAFIGWRRYRQGVLIRQGITKPITLGTGVRMAMMFATALLAPVGWLPGAATVALCLVASVGAEAAFIHWVSQPRIRQLPLVEETDQEAISARSLFKFHAPLTLTTMVTMTMAPLVSGAMARSPEGVDALAALPVATSLIWLHRTILFAIPEVVITLYRPGQADLALRKFSLTVGGLLTALMLLSAAFGVDKYLFVHLFASDQRSAELAHVVFVASALTPLVGAFQNYLRGVLTAEHRTGSRLVAAGVSVAVLAATLFLGVAMKMSGPLLAGVSLTLSLAAELALLGYLRLRGDRALKASAAAA